MAHHVARLDVAALGNGDSNRLANEPEPSAGPAGLELTDAGAEDDAVSGVERRLAVDAADAAALEAVAAAARRAATEATTNELLARERLEAARVEIARLRASATRVTETNEFGEEADSSPALLETAAVGSSPPLSPVSRDAQQTQTSPPTPLADVGVGVGPSLPGSRQSTPLASPSGGSPAPEARAAAASPLESLAAANLGFAFSPDVSPRGSGSLTPARDRDPGRSPPPGDEGAFPRRDARDARALAERLEAALTATAAAESRARVAEAAAVAAEAAAFDAVDMAMEYADETHSPRRSRRAAAETPPGSAPSAPSAASSPASRSYERSVSPRLARASPSAETTPPPRALPGGGTRVASSSRPAWGSSARAPPAAAAGAESPRARARAPRGAGASKRGAGRASARGGRRADGGFERRVRGDDGARRESETGGEASSGI